MEHRRLDALARALALLLDRRETVAAALAFVLAALVAGDDSLARKGGKGGGKGKGKKKRKRRRRGGGGGASRNCDEIALTEGADLHGCDLREHPELGDADFTNAKLEDSILSGADLSGVKFQGARLWRAKLDGAMLQNARFDSSGDQRTDIFGVDLTDANLDGADLDLDEVYYAHYATFCRTTMPNGDANNDDCPPD
jgi:hypothetical protein